MPHFEMFSEMVTNYIPIVLVAGGDFDVAGDDNLRLLLQPNHYYCQPDLRGTITDNINNTRPQYYILWFVKLC